MTLLKPARSSKSKPKIASACCTKSPKLSANSTSTSPPRKSQPKKAPLLTASISAKLVAAKSLLPNAIAPSNANSARPSTALTHDERTRVVPRSCNVDISIGERTAAVSEPSRRNVRCSAGHGTSEARATASSLLRLVSDTAAVLTRSFTRPLRTLTLPRSPQTVPLPDMKHSGKARKAAFKIIIASLIAVVVVWALIAFGTVMIALLGAGALAITPFALALWGLFALFTLYFFRDPTPTVPAGTNLILCPAHGKVDVIDRTSEPEFMGGECQRVSIFLSVLDVHVQNAPVSGKVVFFKYTEGEFMNAIRTECAQCNENALLGFDATEPQMKLGLRLIAGVIARRIVPYIKPGDEVIKGERISLVQFGSRADIYLPLDVKIKVKLGDHVTGGETTLAAFE